MEFSLFNHANTQEVKGLFTSVFSASEDEEEGRNIGRLVDSLIRKTAPQDLIGFVATNERRIVGSIFFSRFTVPSELIAFMLSPVAIATEVQGTGIGQQLIKYGLGYLRSQQVNLVVTYGDPAFYCKTGFQQISESFLAAPFALSQPVGWLAQSLDGRPMQAMNGATQCVEVFNDPDLW